MKKPVIFFSVFMICFFACGCIEITIEPTNSPTPQQLVSKEETHTTPSPTPTPTLKPRINENGTFWFTKDEFKDEIDELILSESIFTISSVMESEGRSHDVFYHVNAQNKLMAQTVLSNPESDEPQLIFLTLDNSSYTEEVLRIGIAIIRVCDPAANNDFDQAKKIFNSIFESAMDGDDYLSGNLTYHLASDDDLFGFTIVVKD